MNIKTQTIKNYIFLVNSLRDIMKHDPFLDNPLHKDMWNTAKEFRDKHFPETKVNYENPNNNTDI